MIQQIQKILGGKEYTLFVGIDDTGDSVLYINESLPDEATGQPIRYYPDELNIKFAKGTGEGRLAYIFTTWERALIGNSGNPIPGTGQRLAMETNKVDTLNFIAGFGMPILMSMHNGFVRAILGYNNLPPFNPANGAVMDYTDEQEAEAPTNDYHPLPIIEPETPEETEPTQEEPTTTQPDESAADTTNPQ